MGGRNSISKKEAKKLYFEKIQTLLTEFQSLFIATVDNVSSQQLHEIRKSLRDIAVILGGKNTMIKRAIRDISAENPDLEKLLPVVKGNVAFVFTNQDLKTVRDKLTGNVANAPAKTGAIAPCDVWIKAINTGMEPDKTSFFQALQIPTKITRGTIEIVSDIHLVQKDARVGASEATLLNMLNISPFTYGMKVINIYDKGNVFMPSILDIDDEQIIKDFLSAGTEIAAISLAINYPTITSVPHLVINNFKDLLSISIATDYTISYAEHAKAYLADPSAFAAAAPVSAAVPDAQAPAQEKEQEEESDDDMGFGLFD